MEIEESIIDYHHRISNKSSIYTKIFKPFCDRILAIVFLIVLSPLFLAVSIFIKFDSKGPVFFVQDRLGYMGRVFKIIKFRSMITNAKRTPGQDLYETDPVITKAGRILRRTSIDEIPQLINILKGDMSFIGPRPPVTYYPRKINEYSSFELQRFYVKPGISGLAQVRCREIHDWDINIPIDVEYVKNYSLSYDLKLFILSLFMFFKRDNIYSRDQKQQNAPS